MTSPKQLRDEYEKWLWTARSDVLPNQGFPPTSKQIADWWIAKIQERDKELFQAMEEKKVEIPEGQELDQFNTGDDNSRRVHNQAISGCQSLLTQEKEI